MGGIKMKQSTPFVITISRQLGSGGAYIGQHLAQTLDIFYADREIIHQAAKQLSVLEEEVESRDEKIISFWQSFSQVCAFTPGSYMPPEFFPPTDNDLFKTETEIIRRIAGERSAVIIGRCGSYILRDHPNLVSVFLHGDASFRKKRLQDLYNETEEKAGKMIAQSDKERALYYHAFTGREWTDARQYALSIDTSKIGVDKAVQLILNYLE
jgi:CMP/dCMP kinase